MALLSLSELLRQQFPNAVIGAAEDGWCAGTIAAWDSLGHFNLLLSVEEAYGVRFSMNDMAELKTLGDIRRALAREGVAVGL